MIRASVALLCVVALACGPRGRAAEPPETPSPASPGPMQEKPVSDWSRFTDGPALAPPDALLTWLEASGGKTLRLPVEVTMNPLGVSKALVGELAIGLDTTALSMMLRDHLKRHCGDANPCRVWLEGTWGPLMGGPLAPSGPTFAVRGVIGPVDGDAGRVKLLE